MATLADLRNDLLDQVDWDPAPSSKMVDRIDNFIDRACQKIALEAPFLFHETEIRFRTQPPVEPTLSTDTLTMKTDTINSVDYENPWAFETDLAIGTTDAVVWKTDRTWDGRNIDLINPTTKAVVHRTRIRSVADASAGLVPTWGTGYRVTIESPLDWETHGEGPFEYKVYTPIYWLQDDVIEWKSGRVLGESYRSPLRIIGQRRAEQLALMESSDDFSAGTIPLYIYRRHHYQLPGPNTAPTVSEAGTGSTARWYGPEPPGEFQYVFTYCWGKRNREYQSPNLGYFNSTANLFDTEHATPDSRHALARRSEPLWESAPSPLSDRHTTASLQAIAAIGGVRLQFPNIGYQQGLFAFGNGSLQDQATFHRFGDGLSGWFIRVYRRRYTADFTNYDELGGPNLTFGVKSGDLLMLDIHDKFELLAELPGDIGAWVDQGTHIPDISRPLRDVHGYQGIRFFPTPDAEYDIGVRVIRRPHRLISDQDAPLIHAEAKDLIIYKALTYVYEHIKQPGNKAQAEADYQDTLKTHRKASGDLRPESQVIFRRPARAHPYRGLPWWYRDADVQE